MTRLFFCFKKSALSLKDWMGCFKYFDFPEAIRKVKITAHFRLVLFAYVSIIS